MGKRVEYLGGKQTRRNNTGGAPRHACAVGMSIDSKMGKKRKTPRRRTAQLLASRSITPHPSTVDPLAPRERSLTRQEEVAEVGHAANRKYVLNGRVNNDRGANRNAQLQGGGASQMPTAFQ